MQTQMQGMETFSILLHLWLRLHFARVNIGNCVLGKQPQMHVSILFCLQLHLCCSCEPDLTVYAHACHLCISPYLINK
jgi:hypothetical protein